MSRRRGRAAKLMPELCMSHNGAVANSQPQRGFDLRTYKVRKSRVTASQAHAISELSERLMIAPADSAFLPETVFSTEAFIIEIGFGMGEATIQLAHAQPEVGVVAIDVHTPGVGRLLSEIATSGLNNVRVYEGDAVEFISNRIAPTSVDGIRMFFPDPWPKKRHHKRRFVTATHMSMLAEVVKPEGFFHFATDWADYADQAQAVLSVHPDWKLLPPSEGVRWALPSERPRTRFEQRGIDAGRSITDLVALRR